MLDSMVFRKRAAVSLVVMVIGTLPAFGQAFPRFSVSVGQFGGNYTTDASSQGTVVSLERDLGLTSSQNVQRFAIEWRPFNRHELEANYVSADRSGFASLNRQIVFQDRTYPVSADVTTTFNTSKWEATYTYWASRSDRGGFGLTLGAAGISIDASLLARSPGQTVTITQDASTNVPVALIGAQVRYAFTDRIVGRASGATLPNVKIDVYSGRATSADARLEFRIVKGVSVGAAYNYFHLNGTFAAPQFTGALSMKVDGPEWYVRLGW